jgi:putative transposase
VLRHVVGKLRRAFTATAKAVREALRPRSCSIVSGLAADLLRSHVELVAENVLLRQQLIVAARRVKRPVFQPHERGLITLLAAVLPRWRDVLLLVKPETVLRWHREGFRLLWRWKSRSTMRPTPRVSPDLVELIRRMAAENRLWGAERVRGELLKLGIHVAKRTVQRYMRDRRKPAPPRGQSWHTFLHNHTVWACDFLQTYDVWFRPVLAFFIVDINTKQVVHVGVTRHPTAQWTAQQLREATPFGVGPELIIRDNDSKFGADFERAAKGAGVRVLRTAVQAPLMNSVCERFLGSVRRECLDHAIVLGERHLSQMLNEYCFRYLNRWWNEEGEPIDIAGVFVSNVPLDASEGAKGTDLIRILLTVSESEIDRFEIKNDETTYREWCVPAELLNTKATLALWDEWDEVEINLDR